MQRNTVVYNTAHVYSTPYEHSFIHCEQLKKSWDWEDATNEIKRKKKNLRTDTHGAIKPF